MGVLPSSPPPSLKPRKLGKGLAGGFGNFRHFTVQVPPHTKMFLFFLFSFSIFCFDKSSSIFCFFTIWGRGCHWLCPASITAISSLTSDPPYEAVTQHAFFPKLACTAGAWTAFVPKCFPVFRHMASSGIVFS